MADDPFATFVLRSIFEVADLDKCRKIAMGLYESANVSKLYDEVYTSPRRGPTLQSLLKRLDKIEFEIVPLKRKALSIFLDNMALESKSGVHMLEAIVKYHVEPKFITGIISKVLARDDRIRNYIHHPRANFFVQALFRSPSLRGSSFSTLIDLIDFADVAKTCPGVLWAAADACIATNSLFETYLNRLEEVYSAVDVAFWPQFLSNKPYIPDQKITWSLSESCVTTFSIAGCILRFPKRIAKEYLAKLTSFLVDPATPLRHLAEKRSYFIQACLKNLYKAAVTEIVESLIPYSLNLAYHANGSFVLSDMIDLSTVRDWCVSKYCCH